MSFLIFIIALQERYQESGHSDMVQVEFCRLHFLPHSNPWVTQSSPIFQISEMARLSILKVEYSHRLSNRYQHYGQLMIEYFFDIFFDLKKIDKLSQRW